MTYREILELYKEGKLEESRQKEVEADIEKQDAISEYLFETAEIPSLSDLDELPRDGYSEKDTSKESGTRENDTEESALNESRAGKSGIGRKKSVKANEDDYSRQFAAMINSSIRRAFIRMGICVGAVTIIVVLFVTFALPKLTNQFFYDPSKVVCDSDADGSAINVTQFDLDVATYTELFLPGKYRDTTKVSADGFGKYDIEIRQNFSWNGRFTNVSGTIIRNKITLYDTNTLKCPADNVFAIDYNEDFDETRFPMGGYGDQEQCRSVIDSLDAEDNTLYTAYVTLDQVYTYSDFLTWLSENDAVSPDWIAFCELDTDDTEDSQEPETYYAARRIIGINYNSSWSEPHATLDEYPYLTHDDMMYSLMISGTGTDGTIPEETITRHVISMLTYLDDNPDFYEIMTGHDEDFASSLAENIQENGLNIYGYAIITDAAELKTLINTPGVAYIYTELTQ